VKEAFFRCFSVAMALAMGTIGVASKHSYAASGDDWSSWSASSASDHREWAAYATQMVQASRDWRRGYVMTNVLNDYLSSNGLTYQSVGNNLLTAISTVPLRPVFMDLKSSIARHEYDFDFNQKYSNDSRILQGRDLIRGSIDRFGRLLPFKAAAPITEGIDFVSEFSHEQGRAQVGTNFVNAGVNADINSDLYNVFLTTRQIAEKDPDFAKAVTAILEEGKTDHGLLLPGSLSMTAEQIRADPAYRSEIQKTIESLKQDERYREFGEKLDDLQRFVNRGNYEVTELRDKIEGALESFLTATQEELAEHVAAMNAALASMQGIEDSILNSLMERNRAELAAAKQQAEASLAREQARIIDRGLSDGVNLLSGIAHMAGAPEWAYGISSVGHNTLKIVEASKNFSHALQNFGSSAFTVAMSSLSLAGAAFSTFNAISRLFGFGGGDGTQAVLKALREMEERLNKRFYRLETLLASHFASLSAQLRSFQGSMVTMLNQIDRRITNLYLLSIDGFESVGRQNQAVLEGLRRINERLDETRGQLSYLDRHTRMVWGEEQYGDFVETVEACYSFNFGDLRIPGVDRNRFFQECLSKLNHFSTYRARSAALNFVLDETIADSLGSSTALKNLKNQDEEVTFDYFARLMQVRFNEELKIPGFSFDSSDVQRRLPNPRAWLLGALHFVELVKQNQRLLPAVDPSILYSLRSAGLSIQEFQRQISTEVVGYSGSRRPKRNFRSAFFDKLFAMYTDAIDGLREVIFSIEEGSLQDRFLRDYYSMPSFDLRSDTPQITETRLSLPDGEIRPCDPSMRQDGWESLPVTNKFLEKIGPSLPEIYRLLASVNVVRENRQTVHKVYDFKICYRVEVHEPIALRASRLIERFQFGEYRPATEGEDPMGTAFWKQNVVRDLKVIGTLVSFSPILRPLSVEIEMSLSSNMRDKNNYPDIPLGKIKFETEVVSKMYPDFRLPHIAPDSALVPASGATVPRAETHPFPPNNQRPEHLKDIEIPIMEALLSQWRGPPPVNHTQTPDRPTNRDRVDRSGLPTTFSVSHRYVYLSEPASERVAKALAGMWKGEVPEFIDKKATGVFNILSADTEREAAEATAARQLTQLRMAYVDWLNRNHLLDGFQDHLDQSVFLIKRYTEFGFPTSFGSDIRLRMHLHGAGRIPDGSRVLGVVRGASGFDFESVFEAAVNQANLLHEAINSIGESEGFSGESLVSVDALVLELERIIRLNSRYRRSER